METPESQKKNWFLRHKVLSAILALLVLGAIGAAASGGNTPTNTASTSPSPSSTPASANSSSTGDKIAAWNSQYGSVFATLSNDLGAFGKDATAGNIAASGSDCQKLEDDITTAQNDPAIPDSTVEQHWSSALSDDSAAAQDCVQGVNNDDVNLIDQADTAFTQANDQVNETTSAIKQDTGQ